MMLNAQQVFARGELRQWFIFLPVSHVYSSLYRIPPDFHVIGTSTPDLESRDGCDASPVATERLRAGEVAEAVEYRAHHSNRLIDRAHHILLYKPRLKPFILLTTQGIIHPL
jgi:hypothetical protein